MIHSYNDCVELFSTVRTPGLGKPLRVADMRLYRRDDVFHVVLKDIVFAHVHPDNVVEFVLTEERLNYLGRTLSYVMNRVLPISVYNVGPSRYRIGWCASFKDVKTLPEYFEGIRFTLDDPSMCLNRRPDRSERVNREARKVWLRHLKAFRQAVLIRLKLGVRGDAGAGCARYIGPEELCGWIKSGECTDILLDRITAEAHEDTYEGRAKALDNMIARNSVELRTRFGVFHD